MPLPRTLAGDLVRRLYVAVSLAIALLLTAVILTQSLRFLEVALSAELGPGGYLALVGLALPRILGHVLPFAVAGAVLFVLILARRDGLVTVAHATGVGPGALLLPVLALALPAAGLQAALEYAGIPAAEAALEARRSALGRQLAPGAVVEGQFQKLEPGLWLYVADTDRHGLMRSLLIRDSRNADAGDGARTVLADRARWSDDRKTLLLTSGSIQIDAPGAGGAVRGPATLDFDHYALDLIADRSSRSSSPGPADMTLFRLREALADAKAAGPGGATERRLNAWYHRRRAAPLLPLAFALMAAAPFVKPHPPRSGATGPVLAVVAGLTLLQAALAAAWPVARADAAAAHAFALLPSIAIAIAVIIALARHPNSREVSILKVERGSSGAPPGQKGSARSSSRSAVRA